MGSVQAGDQSQRKQNIMGSAWLRRYDSDLVAWYHDTRYVEEGHLSQEQGTGEGEGRTKGWCDVWFPPSKGVARSSSVKDQLGEEAAEEDCDDDVVRQCTVHYTFTKMCI